MNPSPTISIITVVYNGIATIEKTINSVLGQSYKEIEYIIIDGNSKDGTKEVLHKYSAKIQKIVSEPDKGLYDAMNKGLALAKGDYVLFLNSGDTFFENGTLQKAFSLLLTMPDIVYGETMMVDEHGKEKGTRRLKAPEKLTWKSFKHGMLVCHQSIFIKREITENYNLQYKISSDYEWVLKALKKAQTIHNTHQFISRFLDGGLNKTSMKQGLKERFKIMAEHYGFLPTLLRHVWFATRLGWFWVWNKRF